MNSYDMKVGDKVWIYALGRPREVVVSEVERGTVVVFFTPRDITHFRRVYGYECFPTREEVLAAREKEAAKAAREEAFLRLPADERRRLRGVA